MAQTSPFPCCNSPDFGLPNTVVHGMKMLGLSGEKVWNIWVLTPLRKDKRQRAFMLEIDFSHCHMSPTNLEH